MQRSYCTKAIIINLREVGDSNNLVTIITPQKGIMNVTLYGGRKSRLKSLVTSWNYGNIWLYDNHEKNQTKITDFEVLNYHNSFSTNLYKMYAASLAGELAIKTHCAGSAELFFPLICGFLDGMELCTEEQSKLGLIRFLWRFINLCGVQPEHLNCSMCGTSFIDSKFENHQKSYYNIRENNFICDNCLKNYANTEINTNSYLIPISILSIRYLYAISFLEPSEARKMPIDKNGYNELKEIIFLILENNIDSKINTIKTGMGIL